MTKENKTWQTITSVKLQNDEVIVLPLKKSIESQRSFFKILLKGNVLMKGTCKIGALNWVLCFEEDNVYRRLFLFIKFCYV